MELEYYRLQELESYKILDTSPEEELDELAKIASLMLDMPISLITMIDEDRQWYKAKIGMEISEVPRKDSFCQHLLHSPKDILVVNDTLKSEKFKNSPFVTEDPNVRFYAGTPLESPNGFILGTFCVVDYRPRSLTRKQKIGLQILAKKAMDFLNVRKKMVNQENTIEENVIKLKKLTDNVPGCIFELTFSSEGKIKFDYLSEGIHKLYPHLKKEELESSENKFIFVHPEDRASFEKSMLDSINDQSLWYYEYRPWSEDKVEWHRVKAIPEVKAEGQVVLYGTLQDISNHVEYERTLEQILFDISHVLRRPVTSLLGLVNLIEDDQIDISDYISHIKIVTKELEAFTKQLNEVYFEKSEKVINQNNSYKS